MIRHWKSWKSPQTLRAPSFPTACAVPLHPSEPRFLGQPAWAELWWCRAGSPGTGDVFRQSHYSCEAQRRLKMLQNHSGNVGSYRASDQLLLLSTSWDLVSPWVAFLPFTKTHPKAQHLLWSCVPDICALLFRPALAELLLLVWAGDFSLCLWYYVFFFLLQA